MRPPSNPALSIDTGSQSKSIANVSPYATSSHSRGSSGGSEYPTPATPTFSLPDQSRMASSTSSLASTPPCDRMDSPTLPTKSVLHDLAEDPSEHEDNVDYEDSYRAPSFSNDESDFQTMWSSQIIPRTSCDYDLSDGFRSESDICPSSPRRRGSTEEDAPVMPTLKTRLSHRMPSLSRKLREKRSFSSLNFHGTRSAPASRAPSIRSPSITKSMVSAVESADFAHVSPPVPAVPAQHAPSSPQPIDISMPKVEDPIDRKAQASTPLLPTCMMERKKSDTEIVQSPLQSPTIADAPAFSFPSPSSSTPVASTVQSPTLSAKTSTASFSATRTSQARSSTEYTAPSDRFGDDTTDEWSDRLGHANFDIQPAPYAPIDCTVASCIAFTADWESARKHYLGHATRVSEDYGPTSHTLKLTEQKWAAIDSQWKLHYDMVIARAKSCGIDVSGVPCLTERTSVAKLPSMDPSDSRGKTLTLADNGEIVGPMVTYVSRIKPQSKKNAFIRFFSDLRLSGS